MLDDTDKCPVRQTVPEVSPHLLVTDKCLDFPGLCRIPVIVGGRSDRSLG